MKAVAKIVAEGIAFLLILPSASLYWLCRWMMGAERAFPGWSQAFALIPGLTGTYLRRAFYRLVFVPLRGGMLSVLRYGLLTSDG